MREIKLEILRHGRDNNQLLSSLTPYLALLENEPAKGLSLGFDHVDLLHAIRALDYRHDDIDRQAALQRLAAQLAQFLAPIGCLDFDDKETQLRLVLSAAELSLLPFELAFAPGSRDQYWLLSEPLALTRESRRRSELSYRPENEMRVLYVFSEAGGPIPSLAHGRALQDAMRPWLPGSPTASDWKRRLRVLPNASLDDILKVCKSESFTHVHILAHGARVDNEIDPRYGIALYDRDKQQAQVVEGDHLASALLAGGKQKTIGVVTLASCEGGQQGGVIGIGGSVAQRLHRAGIPMVLASQFPLTVAGSNVLVRELYEGLAWGEDPRVLVRDLRISLHARFPLTHDWASLVHYFSGGSDVAPAVKRLRVHRATESLDLLADRQRVLEPKDLPDAIEQACVAIAKLEALAGENSSDKDIPAQALRRKASGYQHLAWLQVNLNHGPGRVAAIQALELACESQWKSYQWYSQRYDALLMHAILHLVLKCANPYHVSAHGKSDEDLVEMVKSEVAARRGRPNLSKKDRAWLLADEALLASILPFSEREQVPTPDSMVKLAQDLQAVCGSSERMPWYSARRQASRWWELYAKLPLTSNPKIEASVTLMRHFYEALPEIARPVWDYGIRDYAAVG